MIDVYDFDTEDIVMRYHTDVMLHDARRLGRFITQVSLEALDGQSISDYQAWGPSVARSR
jgi:hypothetical protein